jgi:hypothetical protein
MRSGRCHAGGRRDPRAEAHSRHFRRGTSADCLTVLTAETTWANALCWRRRKHALRKLPDALAF